MDLSILVLTFLLFYNSDLDTQEEEKNSAHKKAGKIISRFGKATKKFTRYKGNIFSIPLSLWLD